MNGELELGDWHPRSPCRRPHWRWLRANALVDSVRRPSRRWDDGYVCRARRFLLRARRGMCQTSLLHGDPAIWGACLLHRTEHWMLRAELEARVLAGEDPDRIAARLALAPDALGAYIKLFFDVADRLRAVDYIRAFAIGPEAFDGSGRATLGQVWKLLGYQGGPLVVDLAVEASGGLTRPGLAQAGVKDSPALDEMRWLIALKRLPRDGRTISRLLRLELLRLELERRESGAAGGGLATAPAATPPRPMVAGLLDEVTRFHDGAAGVGATSAAKDERLPSTSSASAPPLSRSAGREAREALVQARRMAI